MIAALVLLGLSAIVVFAAPRMLTALTASGRRPLLSIVSWQLSSWSVLFALVMSAAFALKPSLESWVRVPAPLRSCFATLGPVLVRSHAGWLQGVAAAMVLALLARLSACAAAQVHVMHRRRSRQRMLLSLVSEADATLGAQVVRDDIPVAYCVPGHGGCVVFSSAAIERLTLEQRCAVAAHERAHLRGRHHLLLASTALLSRAFPRVPLFVQAHEHTARLVEMRADDVAARRHGERAVATALLSLADVTSPAGVLAATGVATAMRVERLVTPGRRRRASLSGELGLALAAGVISGAPVLLAVAAPAVICHL